MLTVEQVELWRLNFKEWSWGSNFYDGKTGRDDQAENQAQLQALCDLAKTALTPPQDVAALVSELRGLVERATSEQDWFDLEQLECQGFAHKDAALIAKLEPTNMTKLLDCVTSLSARNRELEGENGKLTIALEDVALLDGADGHELTLGHASQAVEIAKKTLGKHPSQIFSERFSALHKDKSGGSHEQ